MLTSIQQFQAENLARMGGFSHKLIAAMVFGHRYKTEKVLASELSSVQRHLGKKKVRVTDWRNGRTVKARACATESIRPKKRKAG